MLSDSRLTHAYVNSLTSLGVHCLINKPTRFMHNCTPSLLDHIYTNDNLHYLYPGLFPLDISDHLPSFLLIEFSKNKQHAPLWRRCYKNFNVDSFLFDLDDKLRRNLSNNSDADSKFTLFLDTFIDVVNTHSPLVKLSRRKTKLAAKPWITKGILKSIKTKNRLFRKKIKHHNNVEYLQTYKKYNNILTHIKKKSKIMYYKQNLIESKGNLSKTWKIVNEIINKTKEKLTSANCYVVVVIMSCICDMIL